MNKFIALSAPMRGAIWMLLACVFFAVVGILVRQISKEIHPFEIAFFRALIVLLIMLLWKGRSLQVLKVQQLRLHLVRAVFGVMASLLLFSAFAVMPIADVTALTFTAPLFATIGAVLFLGETIHLRRSLGTAVGFIGAMIILRPGIGDFEAASLMAIGAALGMAGSVLTIKGLSRTQSSNAIVFMGSLLMAPLSLVAALFYWTWPTLEQLSWLAAMGIASFAIQQCVTRAFAAADATVILPFDFSRLLFAALLGYLIFGEVPDFWTWIGGTVITVSVVYIASRESSDAKKIII